MPEYNIKKDDWVTWGKQDHRALREAVEEFKMECGKGPFQVDEVRGDTVRIVYYLGSSPNRLRQVSGFSADFFIPSEAPQDNQTEE